ncbi:GDSL-type esterase/lipase family protein [Pigmentiphaga litoralis]|uniref:Lysophospholipase L1-like esterase n=1 Tax=Pigmentiphaga litoralis TaxID=516702 RepID=A0A7Y9IV51_9BURK|nr:GDSL-type esterase/lipase family protein [Pigmentiphaga litoralis]NYE23582.1 lysophospholipase L1-like esterase [Pigmentiphaga litoralis]NYE82804.1 lysophospholipase L1-like esterase [Pigmentiphaga litoralis]
MTLSALLSGVMAAIGILATAGALAQSPSMNDVQQRDAQQRDQALASTRQHYADRKAGFAQDMARRDVVMLGDSLTEGGDWNAFFPGVGIANRGIGGDSTEGMVQRLDSVLGVSPRKVFVMAGINDIAVYKKPVTEVFEHYKRIIDTLTRAKIQVIVQSTLFTGPAFPPAVNASVKDLNGRLHALCARGPCVYVNVNPALAPTGTLDLRYTSDHLHLNAAGYQAWVQAITPAMRRR